VPKDYRDAMDTLIKAEAFDIVIDGIKNRIIALNEAKKENDEIMKMDIASSEFSLVLMEMSELSTLNALISATATLITELKQAGSNKE